VGPMLSLDVSQADFLDDPGSWYGLGFEEIIRLRSLLVRGRQRRPVTDNSRFLDKLQELALSVRSVDVEAYYRRLPSFEVSFSPISQPMGASGDLKRLRVADNPIIPRRVDKVVGDDLSSTSQLHSLFEKGFDVYYLCTVLSSGCLGFEESKKLVPTRWAITAVDDTLGRHIIKRLMDYEKVNDFLVYENTYLENHFVILLLPGAWEYEQFEAWAPNTLWTASACEPMIVSEYEGHGGRKNYAFNEGGGYYAGRFAVAEALDNMRRQARAVVFREIYDGYVMPVGVWEVRENVRKAFDSRPARHASLSDALSDVGGRLTLPLSDFMSKSEILSQKRIIDYI